MSPVIDSALLVAPSSEGKIGSHQRVLGLSNVERMLYSLYYAGVRRVAFRAGSMDEETRLEAIAADLSVEMIIGSVEEWGGEKSVWVVPTNAVVQRHWLKGSGNDSSLVQQVNGVDLDRISAGHFAPTETPGGVMVNDRASLSAGKKILKQSLRKPIDGLVSRHLNRHISIATTSALIHLPFRPNHWTLVFTLLGIAGGFCAAVGEPWWLVAGGLLFQGQSILDGCDGELARLRFQFSKAGQWLDSIGDDVTNYSFCFGLAVGICRTQEWPEVFWIGVGVLALQLLSSGLLYARLIKMGTGDLLAIPDAMGESTNPVFRFLRLLAKRDTFVFIIAALAIAQLPVIAFAAFAVGTVAVTVGVILNERYIRKLERV